ncbi:MAG: hypothetical protein U0992_23465 [Planctomycetaceae bacterium]
MPPDSPLTDPQIGTLRAWIEQGAEWPVHWAYRPLRSPRPPEAAKPQAGNGRELRLIGLRAAA